MTPAPRTRSSICSSHAAPWTSSPRPTRAPSSTLAKRRSSRGPRISSIAAPLRSARSNALRSRRGRLSSTCSLAVRPSRGVARAVRVRGRGESFLDEGVAALRALVASDPVAEPDAWARSLAWFHRGRLELALPAFLGRGARGEAAIAESLRLADALDPAARARLELNAELALARACLERGDAEGAARHGDAAVALDPEGPVAATPRGSV